MKTIVTHFAPDVDASTAVWLLKRFLPGWQEADLAFVPAGNTLNNDIVDSDPGVLHVDTGMGMLDHHQTDEDTCAARRVLEYLAKDKKNHRQDHFPDEALERLVDVVNDIDHFREVYYPDSTGDYHDFSLVGILDGLKLIYPDNHHKLIEFSLMALDGIYKTFQNKVWAEHEIRDNGIVFKTKYGQGVGIETVNDEVVKLAQRQGSVIALRKDPKKGFVRIKALPGCAIDLTSCYNKFKRLDKDATWFLHASKKMVLNGSMKNPLSRPTKLTLREVIEVIKQIK